MASETITKRLHISGLTPAITPADLSQRLSSFGTVKALDGFGLVDALGQPRKFGYATIESTKSDLARCMNILSGATWKGAKLRIGEAKPDFRERIQQESATASSSGDEPPKKRRRLPRGVQGVHAPDMSLVTPENVSSRPGWRVTPLGRLVRPVRMRPDHPLPETEPVARAIKSNVQALKKPRKRPPKAPPIRARRRTIDPTKWGSQHLKGVFLDAEIVTDRPIASAQNSAQILQTSEAQSDGSDESEQESESESGHGLEVATDSLPSIPKPQPSPVAAPQLPPPTQTTTIPRQNWTEDLDEEKQKSLGLLQSLFGNKEDEEWGGEESLDSDNEFDVQDGRGESDVEDAGLAGHHETRMDVDADSPVRHEQSAVTPADPPPPVHMTKLKDLFAPREEEGGFSLLGHLDLDLELDDTVDPYLANAPDSSAGPTPITTSIIPANNSMTSVLDFKRPLFFPAYGTAKARDALDPTAWRTWFYRTDGPEDIRKRWEEARGELTSDWKRRHREAVKSRKRRGGAGGEGGD